MNQYHILEDRLSPKLPVRFSTEIASEIEYVNARNIDNQELLSQWNDYIDGIKRYISHPVIAWDYMNRFYHTPNGETYIDELSYKVGFTIEIDNTSNHSYVYVFYLDLKTEEYGLNESIRKNCIVLTESDLQLMVRECLKKVLLYN